MWKYANGVNIWPDPDKRYAIYSPGYPSSRDNISMAAIQKNPWCDERSLLQSVFPCPSLPAKRDSWFELGIHIGTRQRDRQCGLVYISKYTHWACRGKWRYETYETVGLKSQYQIYVVHKCKHSYMHRPHKHLAQLRNVKWKVSVTWPLIQSICPEVKTLNLTPITPCLLRGNMCHGKNRWSLEIRQYYFSPHYHISINCNLYQNEEGG